MPAPEVGQSVIAATFARTGDPLTLPAKISAVVHDASRMLPGTPHLVNISFDVNDRGFISRDGAPLFATEADAKENGNPMACWYAS